MLFKLSLTGLRSRFKDYAVLFSGLTLSAAIFYMFLAIASNKNFLKGASKISFETTKLIFSLGIVLLALITLVYLIYANNFLLSMRKKDYGMYMMLGAKNGKIGQLILLETLVIGLLSTAIGTLLGIGLAQWVSTALISQLGLMIHSFYGFYLPALIGTFSFYAIIFFIASMWNRRKLVKTSIVNLLHEDQTPVKLKQHPALKTIEAFLGIIILATGYWAMSAYMHLLTNSIWIGFITITLGSYFVFDSLFTIVINLLQKNNKFKNHGLRLFTLGQLKFRLTDYTKILSVISILFALALGAITVGLNFNNLTDQVLDSEHYDIVLYQKNKAVNNQLKKVSVKSKTNFNYKIGVEHNNKIKIYIDHQQLDQAKIKFAHFYLNHGKQDYKTYTINSRDIISKGRKTELQEEANTQLASLTRNSNGEVVTVSSKKYDQITAPQYRSELLLVNNFKQNFKQLEKLQNLAIPHGRNVFVDPSSEKTIGYRLIGNLASGFEFMGFFLGIAFLAMLASTLMFKVLSGANSDKPRYNMLWKIGAKDSKLKNSIRKEIAVLFTLPAILGVIDVLFGLQFFKSLLRDPYDKIWIPFTLFFVLYLLYYFITVFLYEHLVLKNK